jgi:DNA-binding response OmpR family regulator
MKCHSIAVVGTWEILVVDADPNVGEVVKRAAGEWAARVRTAQSVDQAKAQMKFKAADVLLVNLQINDNSGVELIRAIRGDYPAAMLIALSRTKRSELCIEAWRAGAADMLVGTVAQEEVRRSLEVVMQRRTPLEQLAKRNGRLRQVCKQLNKARHDIRQQVDLLCNDLVRAYQEMAHQLNTTQLTVDYCQMIGNEIEVEGLLRKTMEWVLGKIGPVNAAVYLADAQQQFALGAYLNLDTEADAPLINAMGDTIVKQSAAGSRTIVLDEDRLIGELFGAPGELLKGRAWLCTGCYAPTPKRECLAVLVVFRKQGETLEPMRAMTEAIAPILGERIEQALGLYHRLHSEGECEDADFDAEE